VHRSSSLLHGIVTNYYIDLPYYMLYLIYILKNT